MKKVYFMIALVLSLFACQKEDSVTQTVTKNKFLVIGDTVYCNTTVGDSLLNLYYIENKIVSDSIDIDFDKKYDFKFSIDYRSSDCSDVPDIDEDSSVIWDCYPTLSVNNSFINFGSYQIAYSSDSVSPLRLSAGDTISDKNVWLCKMNNLMEYSYFGLGMGGYGRWVEVKDGYLGLRKIEANDTCYGWMYIDYSKLQIIITGIAIQKKEQ
jgi:hypothetical protein